MPDTNEQNFIGTIPEHYDAHLGPVLFADYAEEMARRAAALAPGKVLETAAGTGIVSRALRNHLSADATLTITDLNASMLEVARRKFAADEAVDVQPASALALPFIDGGFNLVVSQFGVMFFPDKDQSYREAFRVLAPGGSYLLSVFDNHSYNAMARIAYDVTARFFPENPPSFLAVPYSYTFEEAKGSLLAAGFDQICACVVRVDNPDVDLASSARGFVYGSPTIDQINARGGIDPEEVVTATAKEFQSAFGPSPASVRLQATFISGRKPA
jgi:SAM-dependent methyltransferase